MRSKLGTHFNFPNWILKGDSFALLKELFRVSRKASLSPVLICKVRDKEICSGIGTPRSERREGVMSGTGNGFWRSLLARSIASLTEFKSL